MSRFPQNLKQKHNGIIYKMRTVKSLIQLFRIKEREEEYYYVNGLINKLENDFKDHVGINKNCDSILRYYMIESESHQPQQPHLDFDYDRMKDFVKSSNDYYIAFFPVTSMGMHLQL